MNEAKSILQSRTIWANCIGLAAVLLPAFGFDTSSVEPQRVIDTAAQVVAGASFLLSTLFRVTASKKLV